MLRELTGMLAMACREQSLLSTQLEESAASLRYHHLGGGPGALCCRHLHPVIKDIFDDTYPGRYSTLHIQASLVAAFAIWHATRNTR